MFPIVSSHIARVTSAVVRKFIRLDSHGIIVQFFDNNMLKNTVDCFFVKKVTHTLTKEIKLSDLFREHVERVYCIWLKYLFVTRALNCPVS